MIIELVFALAVQASTLQEAPTLAQEREDKVADAPEQGFPDRIVWFTQLDQALAEAKRTNRPILLNSAAPACSGVPGMW